MAKPKKTIEWFTGLYEGEGCISFSSRALRMAIGSNDEDVLNEIVKVLKLGKVRRKYPCLNPNHNQQYVWTLTKRNDVLSVVEKILPYMGKRRTTQINKTIKGLVYLPERRNLLFVENCGLVSPNEITSRGAKYHLKRGEKPCKDCASANRNYLRKWRKKFYKANK